MMKKIISAALALVMAASAAVMSVSAAETANGLIAHYDFSGENILESDGAEYVKNLAMDGYDAEIMRDPEVNGEEGFVSLTGGLASDTPYVSIPKELFADNAKNKSCSISMFIRNTEEEQPASNRVLLGAGTMNGGHGNYFSLRTYNPPEGGFTDCLRLCTKFNPDNSDIVEDTYVQFPVRK